MIVGAPLEYRAALDAALAWLPQRQPPLIRCDIAALRAELAARPGLDQTLADECAQSAHSAEYAASASIGGALWVEPLRGQWRAALGGLRARLPVGAPLAIVFSQPLAGLLPERRAWPERPLGLLPGGALALLAALRWYGFRRRAYHGFHSAAAALRLAISAQLDRRDRRAAADRWHFAARLHYTASGLGAVGCTVGLWLLERTS